MTRCNITTLCCVLTTLLVHAATAPAQTGNQASAKLAPVDKKLIPSKWFRKAKGYEKALALQKETGADIFIYFTRQAPSSEKGLCTWFENKGVNASKVRKYLRNYIRVKAPLPSNPATQRLAEEFDVGKTPIVFIVQPNGWKAPCRVFDWSGGRPELYSPEELIEFFRARSSERYALNEQDDKKK